MEKLKEINTVRVSKNDGILHIFAHIKIYILGYRCKSGIVTSAWRVTKKVSVFGQIEPVLQKANLDSTCYTVRIF